MRTPLMVAVGVVALGAALVWQGRPSDPVGQAEPAASAAKQPQGQAALFAGSFSGTQPDGAFQLNGDQLIPDSRLLAFFDYYLAAQGERTLTEIRRQIEDELTATLPAPAASEAKRILAAYLAYKQELADVERMAGRGATPVERLRQQLHAASQARSRHFSPREIQSLFGNVDEQDEQALALFEIQQNPALDAGQKAARLAALDAALPEAVRQAHRQPIEHSLVQKAVDSARREGASEAQVFQLRSQQLGGEAAQRLAELDKEETQWTERIRTYLAERQRILASPEAGRDAALQQLRQSRFSQQEQQRLAAYEEHGSPLASDVR